MRFSKFSELVTAQKYAPQIMFGEVKGAEQGIYG
jgi:hypothetical protein